MMRKFLQWFFRNRETGDVTIVQAPNLVLWMVIAAGVLLWIWPATGSPHFALEIIFSISSIAQPMRPPLSFFPQIIAGRRRSVIISVENSEGFPL